MKIMLLHCTLVRAPGAALQGPPVELTIEGPRGACGVELQAQLSSRFGTKAVSIEGQDLSALAIGQAPLVSGAVLVDGASPETLSRSRHRTSGPPAPVALAVQSGAGAGLVVPLRRGTYTIGRSHGEILIPDANISRTHARVVVTETAISLVDLGSANGTEVDGERVRNAFISTGSTIRCGNSTMSLVVLEHPGRAHERAGLPVNEPLAVRRREDPVNRAGLLLMAGLPLILGVGLAVVTGMWMFLAFTAVSAISLLVPLASGRSQRRDFAEAVQAAVAQDQERRRRAAPPLSDLTIGLLTAEVPVASAVPVAGVAPVGAAPGEGRDGGVPAGTGGVGGILVEGLPAGGSPAGGSQGVGGQGVKDGKVRGLWLRLGLAVQPANLQYEPPDPGIELPSAGMLPLTLDAGRPLTTIRGPMALVDGLTRSFLIQFAGYPSARHTQVVVHGSADQLPLAARQVRGFTLSTNDSTIGNVLERGPAPGSGVLILLDKRPQGARITRQALASGWQVIHLVTGGTAPGTADIELDERSSFSCLGGGRTPFHPDLVPLEVFNEFCRRLAQETTGPGKSNPAIPASCALEDLLPGSTPEISKRWMENTGRPGLSVPIGRALDSAQVLDLQADGPHLLVAGTTGSGKSEFLRSFTVALALSYPPERVTFLFVDFKGGSGLGPLTGFPHCVGMLTDLASHELDRTLISLRAEIRFREEAMAAAQAPDISAYRRTSAALGAPVPHLVIVIDEFRMLVEEAPEALRELMRIAAIGRSLGIHLVMATQRPQGALTADIRANVTTSIALRVQSEMESLDIINSKAAAGISVDTPGRAYLMRGTEAAAEFQTGSLTAGVFDSEPPAVSVRLALHYIDHPHCTAGSTTAGTDPTPAMATAPLVASVSALWQARNGGAVRKPVAAPLPSVLPEPDLLPMTEFDAVSGGGGTESASDGEANPRGANGPAGQDWSLNLGLMDLPSEQRIAPLIWNFADHGHLALVGGQESGVREAIRLAVRRLVTHHRESHVYLLDPDNSFGDLGTHCRVGARTGLQELRRAVRILERLAQEQARRLGLPSAAGETPLLLVIAGWGSWVSALRAGRWGWAEDIVHDLVRDGGSAGIRVLISGQRELVTARFFPAVPNRVYFPTGSSEDSRIAWPTLPPTQHGVGRGVAQGALAAGKTAVCQFYAPAHLEVQAARTSCTSEPVLLARPFRVEPLPAVVPAARLADRTEVPVSPGQRLLRIGLGGDELDPVSVRLQTGGVLAVLGGPSSGKSSFLRLLPRVNPESGPWLRRQPGSEPAAHWSAILRQAAAGELDRSAVALVDDADLLPQEVNRDLADLNALGISVVMTAGFSPVLAQRVPLTLNARNLGMGVLIGPRTFMDGDLYGVRFEAETNPPPGRSVLIQNGHGTAVQLGWVPPDEHRDGAATAPGANHRSGRHS